MTFRLDKIDSLFPTPLVHFTLTDHLALNAALVDEIAVRCAAEPGVSRTNRLGWHSETDLFERSEPAQAALAKALKAMTVEATARLAPNAVEDRLTMILEGWINVNPTGAYNSPHDHAGAFWSGVYYVAVPDSEGDSGVIEFLAPQRLYTTGQKIRAPMTTPKARFRPSAGTLLLVPATLTHWVHPNHSAGDRITVAFNASVAAAAKT